MTIKNSLFFVLVVAVGLCSSITAQVATGGGYTLEQSVVGNGGGTIGDAQYTIDATAGQPAAGGNLVGSPPTYGVRDGFWARFAVGTTAADATVSGRVRTANGNGLRGVRVTLSGGQLTAPRQAITGSFGYFTFTDIEVGHTYIVTVHARLYYFAQPSQAVLTLESVSDIEFVAGDANR
ncbi:MAG: carboxypeptidase regulatory-like domain-containing protein [Acidobacteria bacterium]|nr:carboxypeptidase regulatory-like domain-containing protein [Acidobacteriota bacterium]MBK7934716.1 carboxypeptidase regulatory-like domain-containing protein [Acidobacteriota bacterium]